jgi:hypothetical protein
MNFFSFFATKLDHFIPNVFVSQTNPEFCQNLCVIEMLQQRAFLGRWIDGCGVVVVVVDWTMLLSCSSAAKLGK